MHSATSGVERVLTPAARERGLIVTNARGVFSRPIAEYVLMMMLAVSRRLPAAAGAPARADVAAARGTEMRDVTVGIVGLGSIGKAVATLASAFGCRVIAIRAAEGTVRVATGDATSRPWRVMLERVLGHDPLPELLGECDFVVLARR